jgi:hypothetical protein
MLHIWKNNIIHGDLAARNILLTSTARKLLFLSFSYCVELTHVFFIEYVKPKEFPKFQTLGCRECLQLIKWKWKTNFLSDGWLPKCFVIRYQHSRSALLSTCKYHPYNFIRIIISLITQIKMLMIDTEWCVDVWNGSLRNCCTTGTSLQCRSYFDS